MLRFRPKRFERTRALAMLARGMKIDDVVQNLAERNPGVSTGELRRVYFPKGGHFAISSLEGASRRTIVARMHRMERFRRKVTKQNRRPDRIETSRSRANAINSDPTLRARVTKGASTWMSSYNSRGYVRARSRARAIARNKDPFFRANVAMKMRERMREWHKDPAVKAMFREMMRNFNDDPKFRLDKAGGIARRRGTRSVRLEEYFESMGQRGIKVDSSPGSPMVAATVWTPERALMNAERDEALDSFVKGLTDFERGSVHYSFGFDGNGQRNPTEVAKILGSSETSVIKALSRAFGKFRKDERLVELMSA